MKGRINRLQDGVLVGWAYDENAPDAKVAVEIRLDGRVVATVVADRRRAALAKRGFGTGEHGFVAAVPATDPGSATHVFEAFDAATGAPIGSPFEVGSAPPGEAPAVAPALAPVVRPRPATHDVLGRGLDPEALDVLVAALGKAGGRRRAVLVTAVDELYKRRLWAEAAALCSAGLGELWERDKTLTKYGRALLYLDRVDESIAVLRRVRDLAPDRHAAIFYLGMALRRQKAWADAIETLEACLELAPDEPKYAYEAGRMLMQLAYGDYGALPEQPEKLTRARHLLEHAVAAEDRHWAWHKDLAAIRLATGDPEGALAAARRGVAAAPEAAQAHTYLGNLCVRLGRLDEARSATQTALSLRPDDDSARFNARLVARLVEHAQPREAGTIAYVGPAGGRPAWLPTDVPSCGAGAGESLLDALRAAREDWVVLEDTPDPGRTVRSFVALAGFPWAAGVRLRSEAPPTLWRRAYLVALADAGFLPAGMDAVDVRRWAGEPGRFSDVEPGPRTMKAAPASGTVLLVSRFGVRKFGGAEHFLHQMAELYREMGYDILLVGTHRDFAGEQGEEDGLRFVFVEGTPDALLRLALDERAVLAHVVSGVAYEVELALRWLDVAVVHGVHFWRDMFAPPTPSESYYPAVGQDATPRPEFHALLQGSDALYANSAFTRDAIESAFGARTPVIYSLPDAVAEQPRELEARDGVVLLNARSDKGFDFLLDVAALLPDRTFRAVCTQSSMGIARGLVAERGVRNVELLEQVDDPAELYRTCRVVAVPSYRFVETFSRVVLEAHRCGVPVVGSDRGNVPILLRESGIALPEDAAQWANELERLLGDDDAWRERSALATANSERYAFSRQRGALAGVVGAARSPLLVGVGTGLGNIVHTTPLLRNLSRRLGRRVDVVVNGDHEGLLFVAHHPEHVAHVFGLGDDVLRRRYDTVFLTNSFGQFVPGFSSNDIVASRDWDQFHPDHDLHEAEFNLAAAAALLDVPYEPEDVAAPYVGDLEYVAPQTPLVGIHAGSKTGIWAAKRWPHFAELARRLDEDGVAVASFGTADEYVPGTIDRTGGSIREMSERLLDCTHVVTNDSGVMNVVNALGIPLTALFGPTNARTRGPLGRTSRSIVLERECAPCEIKEPYRSTEFRGGACRCIAAIDVAIVWRAVAEAVGVAGGHR